jgi:sugar phosphate isomerase/epimerase
MLLGVFAKTFARATVEEIFDAVAKHRLHCVQFNFACADLPSLPEHIDPETAERIRKAAAERRIEIAAVSCTFNMAHPDANQRHDGLRKLEIIAGACPRLGARLVTLCTGTRDPENMWRRHPDNDSPEAWRDLLVSITKALTVADKHDIALGVEPETGNVVSSARHARRLLDEMKSPRLKIIMDAANLFHPENLPRMEEIMDEAFGFLGADIALAHAKELTPDGHAGGIALGSGELDWDHYLSLLRSTKFDGPLIMHGFEERNAAASVKFLRNKLSPTSSE